MKRLMITTALVAMTMTPAMAQTTAPVPVETTSSAGVAGQTFYQRTDAEDIFASDFIGKSVYVSQGPVEGRPFGRGYMSDPMTTTTGNVAGDNAIVAEGDVAVGDDTVVVTDAETRPADTTATTGVTATPGAATTGTTGAGTTGAGTLGTSGTGAATTGIAPGSTTLPAGDAARPGVAGVQADWEDVGSIDDVVMTRDGEVQAVLIDVGGFLGIGARTVAVDIDALTIVDDASMNDFFVVFTSSREDLENAPEYERTTMVDDAAMETTGTTAPVATTAPGTTTGMGTGTTIAQEPTATEGWMTPNEGYAATDATAISVDDLTNANIYDMNNENVATISDVVVGTDGQIEAVLADVGGFLGIGSRTVALDYEQLEFHRDDSGFGSDLRVYMPMNREELEALPEYE